MKIVVMSLLVKDQEKALRFYTEKLGFIKKEDIQAGEYRWLTLVSPENPDGTKLLLEPAHHPAGKEYQEKLYADGLPAVQFGVADIHQEYERLKEKGVKFTMEPTDIDGVSLAVFDDTCGNLIQIVQS